MEMYADYLKEIGIKNMYHNDKGFAIYGIAGQDCYLEELYVKPECRGTSTATELADAVVQIAKDNGCTRLLGSVMPTYPAATNNLKIFFIIFPFYFTF